MKLIFLETAELLLLKIPLLCKQVLVLHPPNNLAPLLNDKKILIKGYNWRVGE